MGGNPGESPLQKSMHNKGDNEGIKAVMFSIIPFTDFKLLTDSYT